MNVKPIKQKNSIACGPTCIYMVTQSFCDKTSLKEIEVISAYKKTDGMDDLGIVNTFKKLGYDAEVEKNSSWEKLVKLSNDSRIRIIVSWMKDGYKGHVCVVDRINKNYIYLIDPDIGRIVRLNKIQFMRLWLEYDGHWWPDKVTDINLRTLIKIKK